MGIGTQWDRLGVPSSGCDAFSYLGPNANNVYQQLSGCPWSLPVETEEGPGSDCDHFAEWCFWVSQEPSCCCACGSVLSVVVYTCGMDGSFTVTNLRVDFVLASSHLLVAVIPFPVQNEVMTSKITQGYEPLSALTIATLQDMGYSVDYSQAEFYDARFMNPACLCFFRRLGHSHTQSTTPKRRKLSKEGEQAAVAYGAARIAEMQTQTEDGDPDLELNPTVFVLYAEGDEIHGVHVVPDGNGGYHAR